jgi:hypothetical protein
MEHKRRIQFGAAAVIANGLLALSVVSPHHALAASCSPTVVCFPAALCAANGAGYCRDNTPAGCTFTSATCGGAGCLLPPIPPGILGTHLTCNYH